MDTSSILNIYKKELYKKYFTKRSIETYLYETKLFLEFLRKNNIKSLKQITKQIINDYQNYIFYLKTKQNKSLSASFQRSKLIIIKSFLQTLVECNLMLFNPVSDIQLPKETKRLPQNILNQKDICKLKNIINHSTLPGFRDFMIIEILYTTGIRNSELINLKISDIDLENEVINIKQGKGEKSRTIPLIKYTMNLIEKYLNRIRPELIKEKESDYLLLDSKGNKFRSRKVINIMFKEYTQKAKIRKRITAHYFRHAFATEVLRNGASIRHIQRLLGHKKLRTTQIYLKVSITDLKKIHSKYHPFEKAGEKNEKGN